MRFGISERGSVAVDDLEQGRPEVKTCGANLGTTQKEGYFVISPRVLTTGENQLGTPVPLQWLSIFPP